MSVIVPANATQVCLIAGDATQAVNLFSARPIGAELDLCRRYFRLMQNSGQGTDLVHEMRAAPSESGSGPYAYNAEL